MVFSLKRNKIYINFHYQTYKNLPLFFFFVRKIVLLITIATINVACTLSAWLERLITSDMFDKCMALSSHLFY